MITSSRFSQRFKIFSVACLALAAVYNVHAVDYVYHQTNLVSDVPGWAKFTDPNLVNPWGIALSAASPFWIANNGSNTSTLYNTTGMPQPLIVNVPNAPTGQVFNGGSNFNGDRFLFSGEDGTIRGWRGALTPDTEVLFDNSGAGAVYKGLASADILTTTYLYATNFANNKIDVFSSNGNVSIIAGAFLDPTIPLGYSPFNIQRIGSLLYVTYAAHTPGDDDETDGAGLGYVSVFDLLGGYVGSVAGGGPLNAPWGLAMAPSSFGNLGGALLVGNFGDGTINAYDPTTFTWLSTLRGMDNDPLSIDGLWGLTFGNGGAGGLTNTLYFTAGPEDESHGLFGALTAVAVPEPGTMAAGAGLVALCLGFWIRSKRQVHAASEQKAEAADTV